MTQDEFDHHPGWRWCTAQVSRDDVLLRGLRTTFREKLEWLEQAEELSLRLQESRWREGLPVDERLRPAFEARYGPQPQKQPPKA